MPDSPQDRAAGGRDSWTRRRRRPSWCRSRTREPSRGSRRSSPAAPPRRSSARSGASTPPSPRSSSAGSPAASRKHTRRAYRQDVMAFVEFLGIRWPDDATRLFTVSVADVQAFRDRMVADGKAPKTDQPPHRLALQLLQVPPGRRLRVPPAHHRAEPGARPVHPPRLVRPARRDQGPLGHPGPAAHGPARRATRSSTTGTGRS